jgi:3-dehydroquinate synthase
MVDASIGGKTGIDIAKGKNQVGAFWQPSIVIEDISFLKTLPDEVFTEGMGEVIKHAFIADPELLKKLEKANGNIRDDEELLEDIVAMNVSDKASVVKEDENDNGRRQILNYGHTVGHVIERDSGYTKPHGLCVAKGMGIVIDASVRAGTLDPGVAERMKNLMKLYKLPVTDDITPEAIVAGAMNDKKKRGANISVILVNKLGQAEIKKMSPEDFLRFLSK